MNRQQRKIRTLQDMDRQISDPLFLRESQESHFCRGFPSAYNRSQVLDYMFYSPILFPNHKSHHSCLPLVSFYRNESNQLASSVIYKLLGFTFAMIILPIGSYFVTANTIFKGRYFHSYPNHIGQYVWSRRIELGLQC
jgi:hypothetical protein